MFNFSARRTLGALVFVAGLGGVALPTAHASTPLRGYMFGIPSSTMSKADWAAFHAAAGKLLGQMPSTIGQSESWEGPSGAYGTLTTKRIYERHDMPCRDVSAQFHNKRGSRTLNYKLAVCRDEQGEWRIGS